MPKRIIEECANCNGQGDVKHMFKFKGVLVCSDSCADTYEEWLIDKAWEEEEDFPQVQELLREQLPEIAYSTNETEFYDDCPETLAEEYLDYDGCSPVIVYSGTPYIPTLQDEKDYLIGEGMQYCIKDVKPCYVYDKGELKDYSEWKS